MIGLRGPLTNLLENVLWILLFNAIFLGAFAFLPYAIGGLILGLRPREGFGEVLRELLVAHLSPAIPLFLAFNLTSSAGADLGAELQLPLQNATATALTTFELCCTRTVNIFAGYFAVACVLGLHLGLSSLLRVQNFPINRLLRNSASFVLVFFKVVLVLLVDGVLFPLLCGILIDLLSLDLFDASTDARLSFFSASPTRFGILHWFGGMFYVFQFSAIVALVRDVLRPGVLWFLRNPNDPNLNPWREIVESPLLRLLRRFLISLLFHLVILTFMVGGTLRLSEWLSPSLSSLNWVWSDTLSELPFDLIAVHIALPLTFEYAQPKNLLKSAILRWFAAVSRLLCLSSYILGRDEPDERIPGTEEVLVRNVDNIDDLEHRILLPCPPHFRERLAILVALCVLTSIVSACSIVFLPIVLGRAVFAFFLSRTVHEVYTYGVGFLLLWCGGLLGHSIFSLMVASANSPPVFLKGLATAFKMGYLGVVLGVIIPLLTGVLFQLAVVHPFVVSSGQCQIFFFLHDWTVGVFVVKIVHHIIISGPESSLQLLIASLTQNGLTRMDMTKASRRILLPLTTFLLLLLLVPALASVLLLRVGFTAEDATSFLRFAYIGSLTLFATAFFLKYLVESLQSLKASIRDETYLVGQRLHNIDR